MSHHGGGQIGGHSNVGHSGPAVSTTTTVVRNDHFIVRHGRRHPRVCFSGFCCFLFLLYVVLVSSLQPSNQVYQLSMINNQQQLIAPDTRWYNRIEIDTSYTQVSSYKFSSIPPKNAQTKIARNASLSLSGYNSYEYLMVELSRGDTISYSSSLSSSAWLYIIEGQTDFDNLISDGNDYNGYYVSRQYSFQFASSFTAQQDNSYYFVWLNTGVSSINGYGAYSGYISTYDLSFATQTCLGQSDCTFALSSGSDECVVVQVNDTANTDNEFTAYVYVWVTYDLYWLIFGLIMGFWGLFVCICITTFVCCACRRRRNGGYQVISEQTSILQNPVPQSQYQPPYAPPQYQQPQYPPQQPPQPYAPQPYAPQPPQQYQQHYAPQQPQFAPQQPFSPQYQQQPQQPYYPPSAPQNL